MQSLERATPQGCALPGLDFSRMRCGLGQSVSRVPSVGSMEGTRTFVAATLSEVSS